MIKCTHGPELRKAWKSKRAFSDRHALHLISLHPMPDFIVSKKKCSMMNKPVNPQHTFSLGGCNDFWVHSRWIIRRPNATVLGIHIALKRKTTFISPENVKYPSGILFGFGESQLNRTQTFPFRKQLVANMLLLNMVVRILQDSPAFHFPQTSEQALWTLSPTKTLFQPSYSSEFEIYAKQWLLIPGSRKTSSLKKLSLSPLTSLFTYTVHNGELVVD